MSTVSFDLKSTSLVDRTYGRALAAYWSPDSSRLLILFVSQFTGAGSLHALYDLSVVEVCIWVQCSIILYADVVVEISLL